MINYSIDNIINKNKIAIVVVGYNRLTSIKRLLGSLMQAKYPSNDVPLVISIDCSNDIELYNYVETFKWPYGDKYVIIQKQQLGLKEHIFYCGDLTQLFKAVIILEDDLYVSPYFYYYTSSAVNFYGDANNIACIALYAYSCQLYNYLPFIPYQEQYDVYASQTVVTWGQCWTTQMWSNFRQWMIENPSIEWQSLHLPLAVKLHKKAWSKFFAAYITSNNLYIIAPYISYTTNFCEAGVHSSKNSSIAQVPLAFRSTNFNFAPVENLVHYDAFLNPTHLGEMLLVPEDELCVDFYGDHYGQRIKRYLLTTSILPYQCIRSFGLEMRPIDANIRLQIPGDGIRLYDTSRQIKGGKAIKHPINSVLYRLNYFKPTLIIKTAFYVIKRRIIHIVNYD